jgi:gamma-glutamylcyclotransferase (GGCT)/AIG2-like uncharacterized protein YtfP
MTPYLFVYASLRSGFRSPAYSYITQFFKPAGDAFVHGQFYSVNGTPVAIPATESIIHGELYILKDPDHFKWAMCQLDDYEGLNVEEGDVPLYKREKVIAIKENFPVEAWIYWFNRSVTGMPVVPAEEVTRFFDSIQNKKVNE